MKFPQLDFFSKLLNRVPPKDSPKPEIVVPSKPIAHKAPTHSHDTHIQYAPRLKKGWRAMWTPLGGIQLTLPGYMSAEAFLPVRHKILAWSKLARKRKTTLVKAEIKALEASIWEESAAILASQGKPLTTRGDRIPPIRHKGRVHDLLPHFQFVNERYFEGKMECKITWSARAGGLSFHSKRKEKSTQQSIDLVSISRGYDFENCPDWALRGIIYHECLHIAVPPEKRSTRRVVHGREFKRREKMYAHYLEWKRWHESVLPRNVRLLRKGK